jgi:hypothetical protein
MHLKFLGAPVERSFILSAAASLVILIIGVAWTHQVWKKTNHSYHSLAHLEEGLKDLRRLTAAGEVR